MEALATSTLHRGTPEPLFDLVGVLERGVGLLPCGSSRVSLRCHATLCYTHLTLAMRAELSIAWGSLVAKGTTQKKRNRIV